MDGIRWQKWVGQYNESLGQFGKTHATSDDISTLCGVSIPHPSDANIEGESLHSVDCKKCAIRISSYQKMMRNFDLENS